MLCVGTLPSPIGRLLLAHKGAVLWALDFEDHRPRFERSLARFHGKPHTTDGIVPDVLATGMDRYFAGEITAIDTLEINPGGTVFQASVWQALRQIPAGTPRTYQDMATRLGRPNAYRAVGAANGSNPVSIVVPCHRLIGKSGNLIAYGGGLDRKRWLLDHERHHARAPAHMVS